MTDMIGQICMVTGANSGIGRETALGLARLGATVIMVCRNEKRGREAQRAIIAQSQNERVELMVADLSSQAEIRRLAAKFKSNYARLDVLVNNAGAIYLSRQESVDGLEMTFALNHLGYFLLTELLLEQLMAAAPARIINVASGAHYGGTIAFDDIGLEDNYSAFRAYQQSKLANIMFTLALARRLEGKQVTVNSVHPGFVGSNFAKNNGWLGWLAMTALRPLTRSEAEGAETPIYLAAASEVASLSGGYFYDKRLRTPSKEARDVARQERLWRLSEALTQEQVQAPTL